jgi:hypothetical protein
MIVLMIYDMYGSVVLQGCKVARLGCTGGVQGCETQMWVFQVC